MNLRNGTFGDVSQAAGFTEVKAHRGAAFADLDGDGRVDVVVSSLGEPVEIWHNVSGGRNHWLNVKLEGRKSNRDGIGARVRVDNQWNVMTSAVSYASSSLDGVHFGLGAAEEIERVEITWPSGKKQVLENVKANQVVAVREPK